jgi:hypothetical protein
LQLVGGEPAAYFRDACQLMASDLRLAATTHLVGHLLRELDSSLAGVLRPMVPPDQWPERGTEDAQQRRIDAICDALRIPADDDFRKAWRDYATRLHRVAHRHGLAAPRPVDATFRALWEDGQTVILRLARQIEANFTATLPVIDALASSAPNVSVLRTQVPHSTVALDRFFDRAGAAWLSPLREAGYFDNPPSLVPNEDGSVGYQRWPPGRYLARVASEDAETVIEIALALDTDNPEAHESLVDAALALPPDQAARMAPAITAWVATPAQWALPFKVRDLVAQLVAGGMAAEGLALLAAFLGAARRRNDRHLAGHLVGELIPKIFPDAGVAGLKVLCEELAEIVTGESHGSHDYSYIWRPALETARRQDLRDDLVTAIRDAADSIAAHERASLEPVLDALESYPWSIFHRLALDLLRRYPDDDLVAARLTNRDLFESNEVDSEYTALSRERFAGLGSEAQETILGWIEEGPRQ